MIGFNDRTVHLTHRSLSEFLTGQAQIGEGNFGFLWAGHLTCLVGGLEHDFSHILGIIIPTDFHIFQKGRSTTNQM